MTEHVKPTAEQIARAIPDITWDVTSWDKSGPFHGNVDPANRRTIIEAVLALLPGKTEAEVRADEDEQLADILPAWTEGEDRIGTATWCDHDRNVYSLAIMEAQDVIRARATAHRGE